MHRGGKSKTGSAKTESVLSRYLIFSRGAYGGSYGGADAGAYGGAKLYF